MKKINPLACDRKIKCFRTAQLSSKHNLNAPRVCGEVIIS